MMAFFKKLFSIFKSPIDNNNSLYDLTTLDSSPDKPISIGFKTNWFAIKTEDFATIQKAINLGPEFVISNVITANWASGVSLSYKYDWKNPDAKQYIFISPPVKGWIFIIGSSLPYPIDDQSSNDPNGVRFKTLFEHLYKNFDDVQFYGSNRIVDFVAWANAKNGKIIRIFSATNDGVLSNFGNQTPAEKELGFLNINNLSTEDATDLFFEQDKFHEEDAPCNLAALWGINPLTFDEEELPLGVGHIIEITKVKTN